MRLPLCEAPTHQREQHKGQPQHRELHALYISSKGRFRKFSLSCHTFFLIQQSFQTRFCIE